MSRWPTDDLLVELAPDQVSLVHTARSFGWRGVHTAVTHEQLKVATSVTDAAPWRSAVDALAAALPDVADRGTRARVILANRLVRYALVPWSDALAGADEEAAFARHGFEQIYGDAAAQWELRVSDARAGTPRPASAVDAALPGALRDAFAAAGIRLESIQPRLMAVCNEQRRRLQGRHAWLALLEPGSLCLALLQQGRWVSIRSQRIGSGWRVELGLILAREAYLADPEAAARDVFVWAFGRDEVRLPDNDRWQFHLLAPKRPGGAVPAEAARVLAAQEG